MISEMENMGYASLPFWMEKQFYFRPLTLDILLTVLVISGEIGYASLQLLMGKKQFNVRLQTLDFLLTLLVSIGGTGYVSLHLLVETKKRCMSTTESIWRGIKNDGFSNLARHVFP